MIDKAHDLRAQEQVRNMTKYLPPQLSRTVDQQQSRRSLLLAPTEN
jgi:hypothetical protein